MSLMPDPTILITSLQEALDSGMSLIPSDFNADYTMFYDEPFIGGRRYTFAKIVNREVQAMAIFGLEDPLNGVTCYNLGYAVKKSYQGLGLAVEASKLGIEKLKYEFRSDGIKKFYIEAVIDIKNSHSINVANKLFSSPGCPIKERETEIPCFHYKELIII